MRSYITHNSLYCAQRAAAFIHIHTHTLYIYFSWSQSLWLSKSCASARVWDMKRKRRKKEHAGGGGICIYEREMRSAEQKANPFETFARLIFFVARNVMFVRCLGISSLLTHPTWSHLCSYAPSAFCDRNFSRLGSRSYIQYSLSPASFCNTYSVIKNR
jgi:hypothetical protein